MRKEFSEEELLGKPLSEQQKRELLALMEKPDEEIDVLDIPEVKELPPGGGSKRARRLSPSTKDERPGNCDNDDRGFV